jgi:hypothetical protein
MSAGPGFDYQRVKEERAARHRAQLERWERANYSAYRVGQMMEEERLR